MTFILLQKFCLETQHHSLSEFSGLSSGTMIMPSFRTVNSIGWVQGRGRSVPNQGCSAFLPDLLRSGVQRLPCLGDQMYCLSKKIERIGGVHDPRRTGVCDDQRTGVRGGHRGIRGRGPHAGEGSKAASD